ncbi:MAG: 2Fe-2S iron-sulfur cluster binding domain-containing protein [Nitrospira sp.]|nr:2Fe-2S iron-sulfur cluster binding domain-containing protein [Nitrospira sp.]MCY4131706.1 2Fe-2S iron-sulfur cluster binding domain-containing protein [Nitrospira sp.]
MEWVIQGIGSGIVAAGLFRLAWLLAGVWRRIRYRKQQRCFAREAFCRRVQTAKSRHLDRKRTESAVTPAGSGIEVVFVRSGKTCTWDPSMGSLLELAKRNNVHVPVGCRAGKCGRCLTAIKSGAVSYVTSFQNRPASGWCVLCSSIPTGTLILDA